MIKKIVTAFNLEEDIVKLLKNKAHQNKMNLSKFLNTHLRSTLTKGNK